jgi:hypothetical protein
MLEMLQSLATQVVDGKINKDEAARQVRHVSPKLAAVFSSFLSLGLPTLAVLISLISAYLQYEGNASSTEESEKILNAILSQTYSMTEFQNRPSAQDRSTPSTKAKSKNEPAFIGDMPKGKPNARQGRRRALRLRREQFGNARPH